MDRIELVEKLREKAGVSYEDAKAALEKSDWDLLDAVVLLEKEGKITEVAYSTKKEESKKESHSGGARPEYEKPRNDGFERFWAFVGRIIHKGNTNHLRVMHNGEQKLSLPITAFVLLLLFLPFITIPLLIIGLFCRFTYSVTGPDLGKTVVNSVIDKCAKAAEAVKEEFKDDKKDDKTDE